MSTVRVYTKDGADAGTIDFSASVIEARNGNQVVQDAVVAHLANRRTGTANTKNKSQVIGSNIKPWKQKGLGRARAGYRSSPVWRGGGVVFGPKPRSYNKKMTSKASRLAFALAFSQRVEAGGVMVMEDVSIDEPKTRHVAAILKAVKLEGPVLIVINEHDPKLVLAARNLPRVTLTTAKELNTFQAVRFTRILITRAALDTVRSRLQASARKEGV